MSPEEKASLMKMFESVSQEIGKEDTKRDRKGSVRVSF